MFFTYKESIPVNESGSNSEKESHLLFGSSGIGNIFRIFPSNAENNKFIFLSNSIKSFSN